MKRNHLLVIICMMLTTVLSCKKKDKVEIDLNNAKTPEITGFTPGHAVPGTTVTVTGKNFSTNIPENDLRLNNERVWVKTATATTLTFDVPFAATTGKLSITINNKSFTTTTNFTVDPVPVGISTIDPLEGPFDTEVTISGRELPNSPKITINGIEAQRVSWSAQQIKFKIPYNTSLTKHKIKVEGDGKTYESAQEFTVTAPGKYAKWTELPAVFNTPSTNIFPHGNSFVHNKKVYWGFSALVTGEKETLYAVFDPADRAKGWEFFQVNGLPEGLQSASVSVLGDKMYIGNGIPQAQSSKWWSFNLLTKVLEPVTQFPAAQASMGIAFTFKGVMYAGSGLGDKDIYAFNPANNGTWTKVVDDPYAQINGGNAVVMENDVIIGRALKTLLDPRESVYKFGLNNTTPQLTQIANIPDAGQIPSQRMPAFALNGKAYFVINKRVWEYNPAVNSWRLVIQDQFSELIRYTVVIDGKVYAWTAKGIFYEFSFMP